MSNYILDTDICIYWLNGKENIRRKIKDVGTDGLSITVSPMQNYDMVHITLRK